MFTFYFFPSLFGFFIFRYFLFFRFFCFFPWSNLCLLIDPIYFFRVRARDKSHARFFLHIFIPFSPTLTSLASILIARWLSILVKFLSPLQFSHRCLPIVPIVSVPLIFLTHELVIRLSSYFILLLFLTLRLLLLCLSISLP